MIKGQWSSILVALRSGCLLCDIAPACKQNVNHKPASEF